MKKIIVLLSLFSLLCLSSVFAAIPYDLTLSRLAVNYTFDGIPQPDWQDIDSYVEGGLLRIPNGIPAGLNEFMNGTLLFDWTSPGATIAHSVQQRMDMAVINGSVNCPVVSWDFIPNADSPMFHIRYNGVRMELRNDHTGALDGIEEFLQDGTVQHMIFTSYVNGSFQVSINTTENVKASMDWRKDGAPDAPPSVFNIGRSNGAASCGFTMDNVAFINGTEYIDPVPPVVNPTIQVLNPVQNQFINVNTFDFNVTVSVDPGATFSNYTIYINNTPLFTQIGTPDNVSFPLADGLWNLTAIVRDSLGNEGNFDIARFIVDTVNPGDNLITQIPLATNYYSDTNVTVTALNTNLFGHNVTIRDTLGNILFSQEILNISAAENNIVAIIQAAWGPGTYAIVSNESDDHTVNQIPDYAVVHNNANKMISFDTGDSAVSVVLTESWKQVGAAPYTPINSNILSIINNKQTDRYTFGFDFSNPAADSYKYKFEIVTDDKIIYRESSPYKGHFVLNDANWLDFEPYDVTVTHDGTHYFVEFETTDTEIRFQSIGGTNIGTTESNFILSVPSVPGIECGVNGLRASCSLASVGDSITGMYGTCSNSDSATASLFLLSSNVSIDSGSMVDIGGNEYYFNSSDVLLVDGSTIDFNATCINGVGQSSTVNQLQVTASEPVGEFDEMSNFMFAVSSFIATAGVLIVVIGFILLRFRKGGVSK